MLSEQRKAIPVATTKRIRPRTSFQPTQFLPSDTINNTQDKNEFMMAMDRYKRDTSPKPTWDEVLIVMLALGYRKSESSQLNEFRTAIERYCQSKKRRFPTWTEVFDLAIRLGYSKTAAFTSALAAAKAETAAITAAETYRDAQIADEAAATVLRSAETLRASAARQKVLARDVKFKALTLMKETRRTAAALRAAAPI